MKDGKFTAEDFSNDYWKGDDLVIPIGRATDRANALLPQLREHWFDELRASELIAIAKRELLKDGVKVYKTDDAYGEGDWSESPGNDTHTGYVVCVERIEK